MAENESNEPEKMLKVEKVAEILGLHPQSVYDLLRSGQLKGTKILSEWRVLPSDLSAFQRGEAVERAS